jgi:putative glutamine amidotransferase
MSDRRHPLIGLAAQIDPAKNRQYLSRDYTEAVLGSGGIPIIIPLISDPATIKEMAEYLDGILLTGSAGDVDPRHYGSARHDRCGPIHPLRDQTDMLLVEFSRRNKTPLLAICYGVQSLNVSMGGTLIQDIPSEVGSSVQHNRPSQSGEPSHEIEIEGGSSLEIAAGAARIRVNSTHHQGVKHLGQGLKPIACAQDGIVEAVVGTDEGLWILGVQWHPEKCYANDRFSRKIFDLFISECRAT